MSEFIALAKDFSFRSVAAETLKEQRRYGQRLRKNDGRSRANQELVLFPDGGFAVGNGAIFGQQIRIDVPAVQSSPIDRQSRGGALHDCRLVFGLTFEHL